MMSQRYEERVNLQRIDRGTKDAHAIPDYDGEPEHEDSVLCWCKPVVTYADSFTGNRIWTHQQTDSPL